jgi:formate--tetrahydrofolate ligase
VVEIANTVDCEAHISRGWAEGGKGAVDLAKSVVATCAKGEADFRPLYPVEMPLWEKTQTIARTIYGANGISADMAVRARFNELEEAGFGHLPVCMAKTQYSFSTDPEKRGAPTDHMVKVREVRLSAGAEFVVVIAGDVMTMPGLPRLPAANNIGLNEMGQIEGLF